MDFTFKTNSELKNHALKQLKGNWWAAILVCMIVAIIPMLISYFFADDFWGPLLNLLVAGSLSIGSANYFLALVRGQQPSFKVIKYGFSNFFNNFSLYFFILIYTFLWMLLLIVPGIIKTLSYSMSYYIKCENPHLSANEAINASMKLMAGHKLKLFLLCLSFIGWILLSIITLGFGFIVLTPYINATLASFYLDIKEKNELNITKVTI